MNTEIHKLKGNVWIYGGTSAWHFVSLPKTAAKKIKTLYGGMSGGFGSLPVTATIGTTSWKTSIFPDSKTGTYLLPLKVAVRKKERISADAFIEFSLQIKI